MLTVQMLGNEKVAVSKFPDPEPEGSLVVVKVMSSALCGGELHPFRMSYPPEGMDQAMIERVKQWLSQYGNGGHEASGIVWKTDKPKYVKEGDRVFLFAQSHCGRCQLCLSGYWALCQNPSPPRHPGTHSEYVLLDEELCLPLPEDIPFDVGAILGDSVGTPYHAIRRLRLNAIDNVLIVGQGPVGLGTTLVCKFFNAQVIAVDINDRRLRIAKDIGADYTFNPQRDNVLDEVKAITGGKGVDKAIDCTGKAEAELQVLEAVRRDGKMAFLGENNRGLTIKPSDHFIRKNLDAIGCWYFNSFEYADILRIVGRDVPIQKLITHRFPLTEAQNAFETFASGKSAKVVLKPWA